MSALTKELKVRITADANGLKGALNGICNDISKVGKDFEGLKKVGEVTSSLGKKLTAGLTLPILGAGVASTKIAGDFESSMNKVSAISGATGKDLQSLEDLAKQMGATTKFSASESADALSYMGMAGWKTQDMISGLPGVLNLAAAGGTDLALTADILTDGLTSMGLTAKDTDKFVDIMAATCSNANTNVELMGETLKYVGPVAGSLGIEMDDLSVAIGLMGNAGIKGSNAGTALRAGLTNLVKPTKEMSKAMKKYGVELVTNKDGSVDLMGTMTNLRTVLGELDQTTQAQALSAIFGKEAMSGWAAIVNASEGDFNKLSNAIANSEGTAKSMSDTMMKGMNGALTQMKSALEGVAITIGERLTPFMEKLADGVSKVCEWFQNLSPETQTFIMVVAGLLAALGPLLVLIGTGITLFANLSIVAGALGISVGAICAPVLAVIAAIAAAIAIGYLLVANWDTIKAFAVSCWEAIKKYIVEVCNTTASNLKAVWEGIKSFLSICWNGLKTLASTVWDAIKSTISTVWNNVKSTTSSIWNGIKSTVSSIWNGIKSTCSSVFNSINSTISSIWNTIKSTISNACSGVRSTVSNAFNGLKNTISTAMNSIYSTVSSIWNRVKSIFSAVLKPNIKMPKISISGSFSLNPPSVPKFGISWYSKGAIFKRPTVLGGMGVGDKHNGIGSNAEAILPINQLPKLLGLDKLQNNNGIALNIENFNNNTDKDIEYLANELAFYMRRKNIGIGGAY